MFPVAPLLSGIAIAGVGYGAYKLATRPHGAAKVAQKSAASDALRETSKITPHPTLGFDPNMTSLDVSRVNHALQQGSDVGGLFQLAGDLLNQGHAQSAQAVAAKAQAVDAAKTSGLSDDDIFKAMMSAGTVQTLHVPAPSPVASPVTYAADPGMDLARNLADAEATMKHAQGIAATMGGEFVGAYHLTPWG